jgi:hypothetical protein
VPHFRPLAALFVAVLVVGAGLWFVLEQAGGPVEDETPPASPQSIQGQPAEPSLRPAPVRRGEQLDRSPSRGGAATGPQVPQRLEENPLRSSAPSSQSGQDAVAGGGALVVLDPVVHPPTSLGIQAAIQGGLDPLRSCYEAWLKADPELGGRIMVSFTIEPEEEDPAMARVSELEVYDSDFQHLPLEACTLSVFEELLFEAPEGGGVMKVRYPVVLSSAAPDPSELESQ